MQLKHVMMMIKEIHLNVWIFLCICTALTHLFHNLIIIKSHHVTFRKMCVEIFRVVFLFVYCCCYCCCGFSLLAHRGKIFYAECVIFWWHIFRFPSTSIEFCCIFPLLVHIFSIFISVFFSLNNTTIRRMTIFFVCVYVQVSRVIQLLIYMCWCLMKNFEFPHTYYC